MGSSDLLATPAILILAPDVTCDTYGVPALAGRASANPRVVDSLTRHRLKAGLHTFQNENCCRDLAFNLLIVGRWHGYWQVSKTDATPMVYDKNLYHY